MTVKEELSILMRFYVNPNKYNHFMSSLARVIKHESPTELLQGVSYDAGEMILIFAIPVKDRLEDMEKDLNGIILNLYNFYPAFSEKPSETYIENLIEFKKKATPKRYLVNA